MKRALAAGASVVALLIGAPTAVAAEKAIWGPLELPGGGSAFPVYKDLGVDTYQVTLSFATTAPERPASPGDPNDPAYRWPPSLDQAVAATAASGINMAVLVTNSPGWANGGRSELHAPDPAAFASFMAAASKRYPSVRRWMIWGEPNRADRFLPNETNSPVGPRTYARILDAAYGALKAVSPSNIVIGGMTWTGGDVKPAPFMKFMRLPNGRPPRLDWFGHNPFPFRFPNLRELAIRDGWRDVSDLDVFSRQLRRTYGPRAKFWLSEFLVLSDKPSDQFLLFVSQAEQARWLRASYEIADSLDSVAGLGWLALLDEPERRLSSNWGLLTAGGAPKPAYSAFRAAPSERLRPGVQVPRLVERARLRRRGLAVKVTPKAAGRVSVDVRRGKKLLSRSTRRLPADSASILRVRVATAQRGRAVCVVRTARGATVRRTVIVR